MYEHPRSTNLYVYLCVSVWTINVLLNVLNQNGNGVVYSCLSFEIMETFQQRFISVSWLHWEQHLEGMYELRSWVIFSAFFFIKQVALEKPFDVNDLLIICSHRRNGSKSQSFYGNFITS